jgi:hypothetical protein
MAIDFDNNGSAAAFAVRLPRIQSQHRLFVHAALDIRGLIPDVGIDQNAMNDRVNPADNPAPRRAATTRHSACRGQYRVIYETLR